VYRNDLQKLAETRVTDARALFEAGRFDAAYYLAGYAVECALKACIAKLSRHHEFPISPESAREIYSHDFKKLLNAAGLAQIFENAKAADSKLGVYWGFVKDWTEKSRYDRKGKVAKQRAHEIIEAVAEPEHGVLQCIRKYW
jgi:HEPN domain-containing protein